MICSDFAFFFFKWELAVTHEGNQSMPVADKHFSMHCCPWLKAVCSKTQAHRKPVKWKLWTKAEGCVLTGEQTRGRAHILPYFSHPVQIFSLQSITFFITDTNIEVSNQRRGCVDWALINRLGLKSLWQDTGTWEWMKKENGRSTEHDKVTQFYYQKAYCELLWNCVKLLCQVNSISKCLWHTFVRKHQDCQFPVRDWKKTLRKSVWITVLILQFIVFNSFSWQVGFFLPTFKSQEFATSLGCLFHLKIDS